MKEYKKKIKFSLNIIMKLLNDLKSEFCVFDLATILFGLGDLTE